MTSPKFSVELVPLHKLRGRPPGSKNKPAALRNFQIFHWTPKHDQVVALHCIGLSHIEIGDRVGFTSAHITNILSTKQALEIISKARKHIHEDSRNVLQSIQERALNHIEEFVKDDGGLAKKSPFNFIDATIKIAKGVGTLTADSDPRTKVQGNVINNTFNISDHAAERISRALDLSKLIEMTPSTLMDNGTNSRTVSKLPAPADTDSK